MCCAVAYRECAFPRKEAESDRKYTPVYWLHLPPEKCFLEIGTEVVLNVGVGVGLSCVCVCVCAFFGIVGSCWCQEEILLLVHDGIMATDMQNHKAIVSSPGPSALNSHFFSQYPRGHASQQLVTYRWLHARIHNGLLVH
jgi:hypothetical protein